MTAFASVATHPHSAEADTPSTRYGQKSGSDYTGLRAKSPTENNLDVIQSETQGTTLKSDRSLPDAFFKAHKLVLGSAAGLPSAITLPVSLPASDAQHLSIRILLQVDSELLVVTMREKGNENTLYAVFPTPQHTLSYRFQAVDQTGASILSSDFSADPVCHNPTIEKSLKIAQDYPNQAEMLKRAVALQSEATVLEHLLASLRSIPELPGGQ